MNNVINAEERFADRALMKSVDFGMWLYDRHYLGFTVEEAIERRTHRWMNEYLCSKNNEAQYIDRLERLYQKWLCGKGDEVADRR